MQLLNDLCIQIEPVGSVAPKVDLNDKVRIAIVAWQTSLSLLCPENIFISSIHR